LPGCPSSDLGLFHWEQVFWFMVSHVRLPGDEPGAAGLSVEFDAGFGEFLLLTGKN